MKQTVYVDVLIIINIYINYGLLLLTCFFKRIHPERLRLLFASLLGGIYSVIILVPDISDYIILFSRVPALMLMVYFAYGFKGRKDYVKNIFSFLTVNIVFAGAMLGIWLFLCPDSMYFNSGVVYFGIDAFTLIALTIGAYSVIRLMGFLTKSKISHGFVYDITVCLYGEKYLCRGFYDSGNTLQDPFSGEGVTIISAEVLGNKLTEKIFSSMSCTDSEIRARPIPVKTISGECVLPCLRAEKIIFKGIEKRGEYKNPLIVISKEKIHGGEYGALLNSSFFDNTEKDKGETYV